MRHFSHPRRMIDREAEIVKLYNDGASLADLALRFDVSKQRICQILRRNGVPRKDGTKRSWDFLINKRVAT